MAVSATATTLAEMAVIIGFDQTTFDRALDTAVERSARAGERAGVSFGSRFALGFTNPLLNAIGGIQQMISGLRTVESFMGEISGVDVFSQLERSRFAIQGITGDMRQAKAAWADLIALDSKSPFTMGIVESAAKKLLGAGVRGDRIGRDMQSIADAAAGVGAGDAGVEGISAMIARMMDTRGRMSAGRITRLASTYGLPVDRIVAAGTGHNVAPGMGAQTLANMTGQQAAQILLDGFEKEFKGAAEQAASGTMAGLGASLQKSLQLAIEPTGEALAPALEYVGKEARDTAVWFGKLNAATGGGAGLAGIAMMGIPIIVKLAGGLGTAIRTTDMLTTAIERYATAAETAQGPGGGASAGTGQLNIITATIQTALVQTLIATSALGGGGGGAGGGVPAGSPGTDLVRYSGGATESGAGAAVGTSAATAEGMAAAGSGGAAAGGMSMAQRLAGAGRAGGGFLLNFLPFVATLGFGYASQKAREGGHPQRAADLQNIGSGIGTGSLIGTIVGGAVGAGIGFFAGGGVGALPGAAIGSRWGGIAGGAIGGLGANATNHGYNVGELAKFGLLGVAGGAAAGGMLGGLPGAAIGAIAGGVVAIVADSIKQSKHKETDDAQKQQLDAAQKTAENTGKTAEALQRMSVKVLGGGSLSRGTASLIEAEYALARQM